MHRTKQHQNRRSKPFYPRLQLIALVALTVFAGQAFAQTPGLIYQPATGAGAAVLDPDNNGYTSQTSAGFITDDQTESELPFSSLIFPMDEPTSDLSNGPSCGFTDFVDEGDRDPGQKYLDGLGNWIFRLRLGNSAPNAKSYSILIDTDNKFGNVGANADADYTLDNPGFEIEIVLATNFGVFVYDVNSATPSCSPVISYSGNTNYQKSIALSTSCGNMDYFYDFFVQFADLTAQFGITGSTPLRYAIVDNMAANKSSVCNPNSISDVAGVGFCSSLATCYTTIIDNQGGCSANQAVCLYRSACPNITGPIAEAATVVNGTSLEANGTTITVYKNGVSIGTTTVTSGAWSLTVISPALATNDTIRATALAPGKTISNSDCSYAVVGSSCTPAVTALDVCNSGKAVQGYATPGAVVKIYYGVSGTALVPSSGYNFTAGAPNTVTAGTVPSTLSIPTNNWLWKCVGSGQSSSCTSGGAPCMADGAYRVTATAPGKCASTPVWFCLGSSGTTSTPTITTTTLTSSSTSVSGTLAAPDNVAGAYILLHVNGVWIATATTTAGGAWTVNSLTLYGCDTVTVNAIAGTKCLSNSSNSIIVTNGATSAPVVTGSYCTSTAITSVTGLSAEPTGTVIQVYDNGVAEGSTVTVTNGTWTASTGISIAPGNTITAKATATCKSQSLASAGVAVGLKTIDAALSITTSPVVEQATSVSGTAAAGNNVQLYIDGYPIGSSVVSTGSWTVSGLNSYDLYPDGILTAKATSPTGCASDPSASKTVICISPTETLTVNPDTTIVCTSTAITNAMVVNSQQYIIYQLTNNGVNSGSSVLGTGGNVSLTSLPMSSSTTLKVKAIKIPPTCVTQLDDTITVIVNAYPTLSLTVGASTNPVCAGVSTNVTVANSQAGFNYQLRDNATNALVGTAVAGNGGTVNLPTGGLASNTTFNVLVTGVSPSYCSGQLASTITINILPAPATPTASSPQSFCSSTNPTVANLTATGTAIQWYAASTGGSPLPSTTALTNGAIYYATQTSGGCASINRLPVTVNITTQPAASISYSGTPYCNSLATPQSVTLTGTSGGTFSSTAGLTINGSTGAVTPSTSTAGMYTVTYTMAATGACGSATTTTSVTITAAPNASISYSGSPYCTSVAGGQSVILTGTTGGAFSSTAGLSINGSTGAVTPSTSTPGTYTVTYAIAASGGCAAYNTTGNVTVTAAPSATISYTGSPFCKSLSTPQSATLTGTSGGTFSSTSGLTINSSTGAITPSTSTAGSYTVTYSVAATGGCALYSTTTNVTITATPSATISYSGSPFCSSVSSAQNATLTGTSGGTFSSTAGLTLNATTGSVTPSSSTAGTYTVTYTIAAANGCSAFNIATNVTINAAPSASVSYSGSPFCSTVATAQNPTMTGSTGGTFSAAAGLTINASTGAVTPSSSTAGTYTITYSIPASGGCSVYSTTASVTITAMPSATISYPATPYCGSVSTAENVTLTGITNGTFTSTAGLNVNSSTGAITPASSSPGTYTVTYTIPSSGGCAAFSTTASVTVTAAPSANVVFNGSPYCASLATPQPASISGTTGGTFSATPAGLSLNATTGAVVPSSSAPGTYTVTYTVAPSGGCSTYTATATVAVSTNFSANISYSGSPYCTAFSSAQNVTLTGDAGGDFSSTSGLSLNTSTGAITPSTSTPGTYTVTYDIPGSGGCAAFSTTASLTINQTPVISSVTSNSPVCFDNDVNLSVTSSGTPTFSWSGPASFTSSSANPIVANATALTAGTYSVIATQNGCASSPASVLVVTQDCYPVANPDTALTSQSATVSIPVSSNDTDPQNNLDLTSITITVAPANGTAVIGFAGSIDYTPDNGFIGIDTFVYQICDNTTPTPFCDTALVVINTIFINTAPAVSDTTIAITEDSIFTICLPISDPDVGQTFSVTSCGSPSNGLVGTSIVGSQVCVTYTPGANFNGADSLCLVVCDDYSTTGCDTIQIYINVDSNNDSPVINDTTVATNEDTPITVCLPMVDVDAGQTLTLNSCGNPLNGTATISIVGSQACVTYTPNSNFNGTDNLCIVVCDNGSPIGCDSATIYINVTPVNDPPVITDTVINTSEDTTITICLTITDPDSTQIFTTSPCGNPLNGTTTTTVNGSDICITYTPDPNYNGTDSICIVVCDNGSPAACDTVGVVVTVSPVNNPPVINDSTVVTAEDTPITVCLPIADGDAAQVYAVSSCGNPVNGTVTSNISGGQVCVTYTPNPDFNGQDNLCIVVCDNGFPIGCDTATITINVTPVNDPPVIGGGDTTITTNEDSTITVCLPIIDADTANVYTVTLCNVPASGTVTPVISGSYVCIVYTPDPNFNGTDSLCIVVCDNGVPAGCDTITIIVNVVPVNNPPLVNDSVVTTSEETPVTVCLPILDVDGSQTYSVSSCGLPANGLVGTSVVGSQLCITYTPNPNFNGLDSLCVVVCDNGLPVGCDTALVYINVTPVNDLPVVNDSTITTTEETTVTVCLPISDNDAAQTFTVASCGNPINGVATSTITGNQVCVTYTPNVSFNGIDSLCVVVCDNNSPTGCDTATVIINVTPANDAPSVSDTAITTQEDTPITVCIPISDSESGQTYTVTSCGDPLNGTATSTVLGNQVCITYTPDANYYGLDNLCIVICDDGNPIGCDTAVLDINVTPVNDSPVVNDSSITTQEDTQITVCLPISDVDASQTFTVTSCGLPINGTATSSITGSQVCITYTPNTGYNGVDSLCVVVCDNGAPSGCDTAMIYVNVVPINNNPSVSDSLVSTPEDVPVTICLPINDADAGQTYIVSSCGSPSNGFETSVVSGNEVCVTYTPNANYNGLDSLCIIICDNGTPSGCDTAIIYIDVTPVNDAPIVNDSSVTTSEGTAITLCLPIIDVDAGQTFSVSSCGDPINGAATYLVNGNQVCVTYTPDADFNGLDSVCIVVCDDGSPVACDTAHIYFNVTSINNTPSVNDTLITTPEDTAVTICIPITDADAGQTYTVTSCGDPLNGTATSVINGNEVCITYTPNLDYNGTDSLCIVICDNGVPSGCDTSMIYIVVTPVNDKPIVNDTTVTTPEDSTVTVCLPIADVDSQNFTVSSCGDPMNGNATLEVNGNEVCVMYTPNADFSGLDSLCLVVCDDGAPTECDTAMVYFIVIPEDEEPTGLIIPQGFSPNGDGKNDVFQIVGLENYPDNDLEIFNRWGNTVFSTKAYQNDWDGRATEGLKIGGGALPAGTYFYTLKLSADTEVVKGFIYLNR